jgi:hypothetical protein
MNPSCLGLGDFNMNGGAMGQNNLLQMEKNKNLVAFIRSCKYVYTRDLYMAWDNPKHMKHKPSKVQ